jgi:Predicted transmembrane transcriptional regulator (anti-sigma factor)
MSQCETVQDSIGRWLDGELTAADSDAVRRHVEGCRDCAATVQRLEKIQTTLADILKAEASQLEFAPFWRNVQRRIEEKRPWHEELIKWAQFRLTTPRLAWAVPAVILLVLGFLSLNKWPLGGQVNNFASVESIDTHGRNVALLREDETKTTIIWLYQDSEGENENVDETTKSGPAF